MGSLSTLEMNQIKNIWHYFGGGKDIEMNISAEPDFSADTKLETL